MTALTVTAFLLLALLLTALAGHSLALRLYTLRDPAAARAVTTWSPREPRHGFSLLVPARNEIGVLGTTLLTLSMLDHPDFEVIAVVSGDDDEETREIAERAAEVIDNVRVVYVTGATKNKPRALNAALPYCRKEIVGIVDAESLLADRLLLRVDAAFQEEPRPDIVQSGVQLMNVSTSWWSLQNCLEYFFWFRSRLHYMADRSFITLGGNSVFTKRSWLLDHHGWDDDCLAEDCEIGVRLSVAGARTRVVYDPELVTREETPSSLRALVRQRVRWMQGFLQTLRKGVWRSLPTLRQRWLALYSLGSPLVQAFSGLLVPLSIAMALGLRVPSVVALVSFLPLVLLAATVVVDAVSLHDFGRMYAQRVRVRDYVRLTYGVVLYQLVLAVSAVLAVVRQLRGITSWDKTAHAGVHLGTVDPLPGASRADVGLAGARVEESV